MHEYIHTLTYTSACAGRPCMTIHEDFWEYWASTRAVNASCSAQTKRYFWVQTSTWYYDSTRRSTVDLRQSRRGSGQLSKLCMDLALIYLRTALVVENMGNRVGYHDLETTIVKGVEECYRCVIWVCNMLKDRLWHEVFDHLNCGYSVIFSTGPYYISSHPALMQQANFRILLLFTKESKPTEQAGVTNQKLHMYMFETCQCTEQIDSFLWSYWSSYKLIFTLIMMQHPNDPIMSSTK